MGARTLFLGIDGQSASLLDDQIREGTTPRIAELDRTLTRITVENNPGFGDGSYWASAATGGDPSHHCHIFILQFDPRTYKHYWFDEAAHMPARGLWERLDDEGRRVCVIDWPHGPVHKIVNGVLIDNWLQHDAPTPARTFPEPLIRELHERFGTDPFSPGLHAYPFDNAETARWAIDTACKRIEIKAQYCVELLRGGEWDLFAPVFSELHDIGHNAFHIFDPAHPDYNPGLAAAVGDPMRPLGIATDKAIGEIIDAAGPDCEVMMMAGLGMTPLVTGNNVLDLITQRLDRGLSAEEEAPVEKARAAYRARAPFFIRNALSPIKRFLLGEPENPELARRRFFPVQHVDHSGCIRLNLKGRERNGLVEPGEEYRRLIDQIISDLSDIRDADSGEPIVESFVKTYETYHGPHADTLPDLFVLWRRDWPFRRITSPKIGIIEIPEREVRTGDHLQTGDFWATSERLADLARRIPVRPHDVTGAVLASVRRESATDYCTAKNG